MVKFPLSAEHLVFDLEAYVPEADRARKIGPSLAANPFREGHLLLGGVFHLSRPRTRDVLTKPDYEHHWIWDYNHDFSRDNECELVHSIYNIFYGMHRRVSVKKQHHADPVVIGVGISMFDMPCILSKCIACEVAPPDEIYEVICKVRVVDLAVAGIGFLPKDNPMLYPRTHNDLANQLILDRAEKPTGKIVWEMFDEGDFKTIMNRCKGEVKEMVQMSEVMLQRTKGIEK